MNWSGFFERLDALANTTLFTLAGAPVNAISILTFLVILLASLWTSRILRQVTERWLRSRGIDEEGTLATSKRLLHYAIVVLGLGVAIQAIGIPVNLLLHRLVSEGGEGH